MFMKKLRAHYIWGILATIQFANFCPSISYLKDVKIKIYKTIILIIVLYGCETWS